LVHGTFGFRLRPPAPARAVIPFYDTHAHLDASAFRSDRAAVIQRALDAGVTRIVCVGTDFESSRHAIQLAQDHPAVFAAAGWHPNHAANAPDDIRPELERLARHPKVVAIGETGLDYYRRPPRQGAPDPQADLALHQARQRALFTQHLEVAAQLGLNIVIHQRGNTDEDLFPIFTPFADRVRAQFHCFVGNRAALRRILALGSLVSLTGILTLPNAGDLRQTVKDAPLDRLLLETDCPYLAPVPFQRQRCEPAYLQHTATALAAARGIDLATLSAATCRAAHAFFPKLN
jgi:TatD DNase family protein